MTVLANPRFSLGRSCVEPFWECLALALAARPPYRPCASTALLLNLALSQSGHRNMDPQTPVIRLTNPQARHAATLCNATEPFKASSSLHSRDQPLLRRYGYIFDGIKQGNGADGTATHLMPPSVDACSASKNWMGGESDDDRDYDNESTTTSSSSSATTEATSVHEPTPLPKQVTHGVTSSTTSTNVAQAVGGPFPRSSDHEGPPGVLTSQVPISMATPDVEMEEAGDEFEDDVMVYYRAALSPSGRDEAFDFTPLSQSSHVPAPGSKEYEEYFESLEKQFAGVLANAGPRKISSRQEVEVNPGFTEVPSIIGTVPPQIGYGRTIYNP